MSLEVLSSMNFARWLKPLSSDLDPQLVHPGINGHFDPPCVNIHCEGIIGPRDFKLGGVIKKSYGFPFLGQFPWKRS